MTSDREKELEAQLRVAQKRQKDAEAQLTSFQSRWTLFLRYLADGIGSPDVTGWARVTAHFSKGAIQRVQVATDNNEELSKRP